MSGRCQGRGHRLPFQNLTSDCVWVRSQGRTGHWGNLQLLCHHCHAVNGTMDPAAFTAKLKTMGLSV